MIGLSVYNFRSIFLKAEENVSKLIPSIQIPKQEATRARRLHYKKLVVTELNRGKLTLRAPHAPQEILHEYLKKKNYILTHLFISK